MPELISLNYHILNHHMEANADYVCKKLTECQQIGTLILKSHEIGADREQWFVDWQNDLIVICVEHLSESAWVESMSNISAEKLQIFYKSVFCH